MSARGSHKVFFFADGALCGKLRAFLDGELNPVEAENFRDHVSGCDRCATELEEELQLELLADLALRDGDDVVALPLLKLPAAPDDESPTPRRVKPRSC